MSLTSLDIRNQKFATKNFGGYDPDEVNAFLNQVALAFETFTDERTDLLKTISQDKQTVDKYQKIEKTLNDAILTMQMMLDEKKAQANKEAGIIIAEARAKADKEVTEIKKNANIIRSEIEQLKQSRTAYFIKMRNLMRSQEELLAAMEEDSKPGN